MLLATFFYQVTCRGSLGSLSWILFTFMPPYSHMLHFLLFRHLFFRLTVSWWAPVCFSGHVWLHTVLYNGSVRVGFPLFVDKWMKTAWKLQKWEYLLVVFHTFYLLWALWFYGYQMHRFVVLSIFVSICREPNELAVMKWNEEREEERQECLEMLAKAHVVESLHFSAP